MNAGYTIGDGVRRAGMICRYRRSALDPVFRPLQIYSTDPSDSQLDGTRAIVKVPYEELAPGPVGSLIEVIGVDKLTLNMQTPLDLSDSRMVCTGGLPPSLSAQFQMQMTYAVAMMTYSAFRRALGRDLNWGFDTQPSTPARLKIYPFYEEMKNACYDRHTGAVIFGWYRSQDQQQRTGLDEKLNRRNLMKGKVYTSLSHDIIVHEVSHALLHGLRPNFLMPYHRDTLALHEAFGDLVSLFQHFSHVDLLKVAIRRARGKVGQSQILGEIARQFGQTQRNPSLALRTAVDDHIRGDGALSPSLVYDSKSECHSLGNVLVCAIFDTFIKIFDRKSNPYIRVATRGSGILPEGELESSLADVLAKEASELASQFLSICIRALDYCPPVAVTFGDYLRGMITADFDLVPGDPYGYREALVDAFLERKIPIEGVETITESSLVWPSEYDDIDPALLSVVQNETEAFASYSTQPLDRYQQRAKRLGEYLEQSQSWSRLGFLSTKSSDPQFTEIQVPCIESARVSRRVAPDGQLNVDLVVEITQNCKVDYQGRKLPLIHGCTVIIDSDARIRYVIKKEASHYLRQLEDQVASREFDFAKFWSAVGNVWAVKPNLLARFRLAE